MPVELHTPDREGGGGHDEDEAERDGEPSRPVPVVVELRLDIVGQVVMCGRLAHSRGLLR